MAERVLEIRRWIAAGCVGIALAATGPVLAAPAPASDGADHAPETKPDPVDKPDGAALPVGVLEDLMSGDEIFSEFLVEPDLKAPLPKVHLNAVNHTLPTDGATLPVSPEARVLEMVPAHLHDHFDMYLYVSKAVEGVWAQQMFVFEKPDGAAGRDLALTARLQVSTGREQEERYWTGTPTGLFRLDKDRFFEEAWSYQWDGVAIPWSMFFDYSYRTRKSGYAIHAAIPEFENALGRRASAGCIRLSMEHAEWLFKRVRTEFAGPMPVFPFDHEVGLTKTDGTVSRDGEGNVVMTPGYKVLVVIDDKVVRP